MDAQVVDGEETLLDVNVLAQDQDYCAVEAVEESPSHNYLAYSVDYTGDEVYQLFVKDLVSGDIVDHDPDLEMDGSVVWGHNDTVLYYLKMDDAMRPFQVFRRFLRYNDSQQDDGHDDELLLQEDDEVFWVSIEKSQDEKFLFVSVESPETSEVHFLNLQDPHAKLECVAKRRPKVLYNVAHHKGLWWIQSNVGGLANLALFRCAAQSDCANSWELVCNTNGTPLFCGDSTTSLDGICTFVNHIVLTGRSGGLPRIWIASLDSHNPQKVSNFTMLKFEEEAFDVGLANNFEYDTDRVAIAYDSLMTPTQTIDIRLDNPEDRTVLKEREVPDYDKSLYACERVNVLSRDGITKIPVSLVYRKDTVQNNKVSKTPVPVVLYGR
jgi:oligopeptidase B